MRCVRRGLHDRRTGCRSKAVPQFVHQVAKRLDESSQTVNFQVKRLDGGAHKIMAQTVTNPLVSLTADQFIEVTSEMAFKMALADRKLKPADLMSEVRLVPNGWIALGQYQQQGYAYIAP